MTTRRNAMWVALVVALAGCGLVQGVQSQSPLLTTGQALKAAGVEFLETANTYDTLYRAKKVTEAKYDGWRKASGDFQKAYGAAYATWSSAVDTKDAGGAQQAAAIIDQLRAQILKLALGVSPALTAMGPWPDERAIASAVADYRPITTMTGGK